MPFFEEIRRTLSPDVSRDSGGRTRDGKLSLTLQERSVVLDELVRLEGLSVYQSCAKGAISRRSRPAQTYRDIAHRDTGHFDGFMGCFVGGGEIVVRRSSSLQRKKSLRTGAKMRSISMWPVRCVSPMLTRLGRICSTRLVPVQGPAHRESYHSIYTRSITCFK